MAVKKTIMALLTEEVHAVAVMVLAAPYAAHVPVTSIVSTPENATIPTEAFTLAAHVKLKEVAATSEEVAFL
jgi:hypothetical protein